MPMKVMITRDYSELSHLAADKVARLIKSKPNAVLGLPTGSTPIGMYKKLISKHQQGDLSFKTVKTFNLDEYVGLKPEHKNSYHYYMKDNFFKHVDLAQNNVSIPKGAAQDIEAECEDYERKIRQAGGIDLMILGLGTNGHIGFNEPGNEFPSKTHKVKLERSTIEANARFFKNMDEVPKFAITMGIGTIMRCRSILLLASGKTKAFAVKACLQGPIAPALPASALQFHTDVTVMLDREAAALLEPC